MNRCHFIVIILFSSEHVKTLGLRLMIIFIIS